MIPTIALLAPGQGSQQPRMLAAWIKDPESRRDIAQWSEACGVDLLRLGTTASAAEIALTENAQPLLVAMALVAGMRIAPGLPAPTADAYPALTVGHSVGELAAAALAGAITAAEAVSLAAARGTAMARACSMAEGSMSAVVGGDPDEVIAAIMAAGLTVANHNGPGQLVAAGPADRIARLCATPPPGAVVKPLRVAGAFHSAAMQSAVVPFADAVARVGFADPRLPVISNLDGQLVTVGADLADRLVAQITRPVRFDLCLLTMARLGLRVAVSLPPAATLAGIVHRQLPEVEVVRLASPRDRARDIDRIPGSPHAAA